MTPPIGCDEEAISSWIKLHETLKRFSLVDSDDTRQYGFDGWPSMEIHLKAIYYKCLMLK
jgi:hypothetical protein